VNGTISLLDKTESNILCHMKLATAIYSLASRIAAESERMQID